MSSLILVMVTIVIVPAENSVPVCVLSQQGGLSCFPCHCLPLFPERIVSLFVSFHNKVGCHVSPVTVCHCFRRG